LDRPAATLATAARRSLDRRREALDQLELRLRLLSPDRTLARGYSITLDETSGNIIRTAEGVSEGARLLTRLSSGRLRSVVAPQLPEESGAGTETT
jgi:exodeoxyribonuclease VII large subunit